MLELELDPCLSDVGRSTLRFRDVDQLLDVKDGNIFQSIMSSISCLMTLAEVDHTEEVSQLVDFVKEQRVVDKHLVVTVSTLNITSVLNKSFNFNVIVHRRDLGIEYLFNH